ncbi:LuxR C-terminal-related transcriptional regulator [Flammeovirga pacifica]|uniref:HTH luxR-type domain-containing protein n=1 Tax=Flammeovirga pacifica TaxID=915059 RepID=A0A1S1Z100_FLAPC|nr:LuxR C-terminal-related transcriptional regulator [Flammeovirga pacifica]OHX66946.1 hypothetical protein NH26_11620 [Flammeovirga pacifica]
MIDIIDDEVRLNKILYRLTHLAFVTTLIYIPLYYFTGNYFYIPIQIGTAALIGSIFLMLKRQWFVLSGYTLSGVLTLSIAYAAYVTPNVATELLLIPIGVVLVAIFADKRHSIIMFLLIFGTYIFIEEHKMHWTPVVVYTQKMQDIVYHHNIATIFIVSFLILFHFQRNMDRYVKALKEKNIELEDKKEEITLQAEMILEEQKKNHELVLDAKKKDMEKLNANNQLKFQLQEKAIKALAQVLKSDDIKRDLKQIISELKRNNATQQKIQMMHDNVEEINHQFEARLADVCPDLTKTEREICSYIKLKLSTKEIADIRTTSPNTIRVTKHRIRKKLGLNEEVDLESFIQRL